MMRNATVAITGGSLVINWPYLVYSRNAVDPMTGTISCNIENAALLQFNASVHLDVDLSEEAILCFFCGIDVLSSTNGVRCPTSASLE